MMLDAQITGCHAGEAETGNQKCLPVPLSLHNSIEYRMTDDRSEENSRKSRGTADGAHSGNRPPTLRTSFRTFLHHWR